MFISLLFASMNVSIASNAVCANPLRQFCNRDKVSDQVRQCTWTMTTNAAYQPIPNPIARHSIFPFAERNNPSHTLYIARNNPTQSGLYAIEKTTALAPKLDDSRLCILLLLQCNVQVKLCFSGAEQAMRLHKHPTLRQARCATYWAPVYL